MVAALKNKRQQAQIEDKGQITIAIPAEVPLPKFSMFERVYYVERKLEGIVVGIRYVSPADALIEEYTSFGWQYSVSFTFGLPLEEVVRHRHKVEECLLESEIQPAVECKAA